MALDIGCGDAFYFDKQKNARLQSLQSLQARRLTCELKAAPIQCGWIFGG